MNAPCMYQESAVWPSSRHCNLHNKEWDTTATGQMMWYNRRQLYSLYCCSTCLMYGLAALLAPPCVDGLISHHQSYSDSQPTLVNGRSIIRVGYATRTALHLPPRTADWPVSTSPRRLGDARKRPVRIFGSQSMLHPLQWCFVLLQHSRPCCTRPRHKSARLAGFLEICSKSSYLSTPFPVDITSDRSNHSHFSVILGIQSLPVH